MKIGYIQFKPIFGKKEKNLERILGFLKEGSKREADLLVLPELCNVGYVFKSKAEAEALSEEIPEGKTTKALSRSAEEGNLCIVAGLCEKSGGKLYNSSVLVGADGSIAVYRKAHLFDTEKFWFSEGNTPFEVHDISKARIGMMICFDWFFPEAIRVLALKSAQIVCHPSNLVLPYCQKSLLGAAVQNRVFIVTANRVGIERGTKFTGMSQIVSPSMEVLARSNRTREEIRIVEIDPKDADNKKITGHNDLWDDRRTDLYRDLLERKK